MHKPSVGSFWWASLLTWGNVLKGHHSTSNPLRRLNTQFHLHSLETQQCIRQIPFGTMPGDLTWNLFVEVSVWGFLQGYHTTQVNLLTYPVQNNQYLHFPFRHRNGTIEIKRGTRPKMIYNRTQEFLTSNSSFWICSMLPPPDGSSTRSHACTLQHRACF